MTFAALVVAAGSRVTGHLRRLAWNIIRIAGTIISALPEAVAACLIGHLRIVSGHMDVVLAAAIVLIIRTIYNRTV